MDISIRGLQNDLIKPYVNGGLESLADSVTQKVLIIDTTLKSFIPPQVHKMNPKLLQIWVCDICIIPKDMHIDFNLFIIKLVTYLQQKSVGRHTLNRAFSTTSDENYKNKVFLYGDILFQVPRVRLTQGNCVSNP